MEKFIFGYYIGNDVHFDLKKQLLVNMDPTQRARRQTQVILRDTMFRLFVYLLDHADGSIINNVDLLIEVWDKHGLCSSNQRLWQVVQALKEKLALVGVPSDFIMRIETKGYYVKEHMITVLYSEKKMPPLLEHRHDIRHH